MCDLINEDLDPHSRRAEATQNTLVNVGRRTVKEVHDTHEKLETKNSAEILICGQRKMAFVHQVQEQINMCTSSTKTDQQVYIKYRNEKTSDYSNMHQNNKILQQFHHVKSCRDHIHPGMVLHCG